MVVDQPTIAARATLPALGRSLIGFVERRRANREIGPCLGLPFAVPVVHIALDAEADEPVCFSSGSAQAGIEPRAAHGATFVVALGMRGAAALFAGEAAAAAGRFVPAEEGFWSTLRDQLSDATSFAARADIAERALAAQIAAAGPAESPTLNAADAIVQDRWKGSVAALADAFGIEERTLRNRFRREIGWSPKMLLRVARFNRALRALHPRSWAGQPARDVRLEFADDAHFHREFTALAGISPKDFARAKRSSGDAMLHNVTLESLRSELTG